MMNLRPTLIDRYIVKKFILSFLLSLLVIITIVIVFDISEKISKFVEYHAPLEAVIFQYYVNFIPYFINMFSPLFVFITVIFFTSRMAANSEIIAILSGGISYRRLMVPYMFSAAVIAFMSLMLNLYVIPRSNEVRVAFEAKYVRSHVDFKRSNIHYMIAPGEFVFVESFSDWNKTAYRFTLEEIQDGRMVSKLSADRAVWDSTMGGWHLENYFLRNFSEGLKDEVKVGAKMDTIIPLTVTDFYCNEKTVQTLSTRNLNQLIKTQKMRGDSNVIYAQIEKNNRISLPFSAFILTIIGVSLSSHKRRGGIGWNVALGIALAFSYILFMRFSQMFVFTGMLPPGIALWIPNVLYSFIAFYLYKRAPK
ncbi:MAG: LptF/LptG family permease [Bacteroidales bacterium]|nr:LptF/LptG family permease [Bacteroidales bacterium]